MMVTTNLNNISLLLLVRIASLLDAVDNVCMLLTCTNLFNLRRSLINSIPFMLGPLRKVNAIGDAYVRCNDVFGDSTHLRFWWKRSLSPITLGAGGDDDEHALPQLKGLYNQTLCIDDHDPHPTSYVGITKLRYKHTSLEPIELFNTTSSLRNLRVGYNMHLQQLIDCPPVLQNKVLSLDYLQPLTSLTKLGLDFFRAHLVPSLIPSSVTRLSLKFCPIAVGSIPSSVTNLSVLQLDHPMAVGMFPASLTKLTLTRFFKHFTPGIIPSSVTHLSFLGEDAASGDAGQSSSFELGSLPSGLHSLELFYSQPFQRDILPSSLKHLRIVLPTHKFVNSVGIQPLAEEDSLVPTWFLPPSLKSLSLLHFHSFTPPKIQPGVIPQTVTSLECAMNVCDQEVMPTGLRHLDYVLNLSQTMHCQLSLMTSLQSLSLSNLTTDFKVLPGSLPPSLTSLRLIFSPFLNVWNMSARLANDSLYNLPHTVTSLDMNPPSLPVGLIPNSVTKLTLHTHAPLQSGVLPSSLTSLEVLSGTCKDPLSIDHLPASLTELAVHDVCRLQLTGTPYSSLIRNVRIMNEPPTMPKQVTQVFAVGTNIEYHYIEQLTKVSLFFRIIDQSSVLIQSPNKVGGFLDRSSQ
ncbi:hypothetical protein SAMD00019534_051430 [Acytostelium subglobosum LB1]|uniref:hypothetical protein n=1 Tax=Acytostelium subglobosum LB1 TaxID=1410327 RepID=UPI0006448583|nr:hypothetical protein SAMD00019534_051430 [Acytostelium subglobosum LB1]GAM21968.1 hypothetical protein SAMD00019534_051430 [Acytostelium subglobosum LB1]|eukprot:XP_012755068.1 hypothetical protein SAMD00019534_051430 [Acytostelium subglobosum LB1]